MDASLSLTQFGAKGVLDNTTQGGSMIEGNPFAEVGAIKKEVVDIFKTANQKDVADNVFAEFGGFTNTRESEPVRRTSMEDVYRSMEENARKEKFNSRSEAVKKLQGWLDVIVGALWKYTKEALELAVYKFTAELAAMVVAAIAALVTKKSGKSMDITTDGVFYRGSGAVPPTNQAGTAPKSSGWDSNPFAEWNNNRNVVSPW